MAAMMLIPVNFNYHHCSISWLPSLISQLFSLRLFFKTVPFFTAQPFCYSKHIVYLHFYLGLPIPMAAVTAGLSYDKYWINDNDERRTA